MLSNDFVDWKRHPVTREIFQVWKHRHDQLIEMLITQSHTMPPREQSETFAAVKVYREILEMTAEDAHDD